MCCAVIAEEAGGLRFGASAAASLPCAAEQRGSRGVGAVEQLPWSWGGHLASGAAADRSSGGGALVVEWGAVSPSWGLLTVSLECRGRGRGCFLAFPPRPASVGGWQDVWLSWAEPPQWAVQWAGEALAGWPPAGHRRLVGSPSFWASVGHPQASPGLEVRPAVCRATPPPWGSPGGGSWAGCRALRGGGTAGLLLLRPAWQEMEFVLDACWACTQSCTGLARNYKPQPWVGAALVVPAVNLRTGLGQRLPLSPSCKWEAEMQPVKGSQQEKAGPWGWWLAPKQQVSAPKTFHSKSQLGRNGTGKEEAVERKC